MTSPDVIDAANDLRIAVYMKNVKVLDNESSYAIRSALARLRQHLEIPRRDRRQHTIKYTNGELQKLERQLVDVLKRREGPEYGLPELTEATFDDAIDRLEDVLEHIRNPAIRYGWKMAIDRLKDDRKDF